MNSPTRSGFKSKKKYSGALFLENDEFDCFADNVQEESSEDGKHYPIHDIQNHVIRRDSSNFN